MRSGWAPELRVYETRDGCRLTLVGVTHGEGPTLQAAADDLVRRLHTVVLCTRVAGGSTRDRRTAVFLAEMADRALVGEDLRPHVFS